jgi:hypothetical protein
VESPFVAAGRHTGDVTSTGVVRLLNTSGGRVLNLAGDVDEATVEAFLQRYGREPARIDVIDARSVTSLSPPAVTLVRDHLWSAGCAGRPVTVRADTELRLGLTASTPGPEARAH